MFMSTFYATTFEQVYALMTLVTQHSHVQTSLCVLHHMTDSCPTSRPFTEVGANDDGGSVSIAAGRRCFPPVKG